MYPRQIKLEDSKLLKLLKEKDEVRKEGIRLSEDIDAIEEEMKAIDTEVKSIEATLQADDLKKEAEGITEEFNTILKKMEDVKNKVAERMHQIVPQELKDKYQAKKKEKEDLEHRRKKAGLKIQKINDKAIPIGRRLMQPFIDNEYEDYDSIRFENGEIVATLFSHLDDFQKNFITRKNMSKN
jgi:predicted  nucleic acid-binding Zn-ribbon protein